jgi:hypothetical protein
LARTSAPTKPKPAAAGHRERLRERFAQTDGAGLDERQALELLLTFAIPRRDVLPLADTLLKRFGSIAAVLQASSSELREVPGVGDTSALLVRLVGRLATGIAQVEEPADQASAEPEKQTSLFEAVLEKPAVPPKLKGGPSAKRRGSGLFGKGLLKDAIECLPEMPNTTSLDVIRDHLRNGALHYSGQQTRSRFASYIVSRLFPSGQADRALRVFSRAFAGEQPLRDVCLYRFLKAEPFLYRLILELVTPATVSGLLSRAKLRTYVTTQFPDAKPNATKSCAQAAAEIIQAAAIGKVTRTRISVTLRDVLPESFAFVLHSEFPEPGIYEVRKVETGSIFQAMLWRPDALVPALYELRNRGWISKMSEIDSVRQFTTRFTLEQVVERMLAEGDHV